MYSDKRVTSGMRMMRQSAIDSYILFEVLGYFLVLHYAYPHQNASYVVDAVRTSIDGLELSNSVVFGDFSFNSYKDTRRSQFIKLYDSLAVLGILHEPLAHDRFTYPSPLAVSCIDHVFSAESCLSSVVFLDHSLQSHDHMALKFELACSGFSVQFTCNNTKAWRFRKVKG